MQTKIEEIQAEITKIHKQRYRDTHRDYLRQKSREHYQRNKENLLKKSKAYREKNKEAIKQRAKIRWNKRGKLVRIIYNQKNKEKLNKKSRDWYQMNKEKVLEQKRQYRIKFRITKAIRILFG